MFTKPFGMKHVKLLVIQSIVSLHRSYKTNLIFISYSVAAPITSFFMGFWLCMLPNLCPYNQHKFDFRSKECVFLGYSNNHKGYKCYHIPTGRMYISRDVVFHESTFPFTSNYPVSIPPFHSSSTWLPSSLQLPQYPVIPPPATPNSNTTAASPNYVSNLSSNESISVSNSPHSLSPSTCPAPTRIHQMVKSIYGWKSEIPYLSRSTGCNSFSS